MEENTCQACGFNGGSKDATFFTTDNKRETFRIENSYHTIDCDHQFCKECGTMRLQPWVLKRLKEEEEKQKAR